MTLSELIKKNEVVYKCNDDSELSNTINKLIDRLIDYDIEEYTLSNETAFYDTIRLININGSKDKISISGYNERFSIDNEATGSSITIKMKNNKPTSCLYFNNKDKYTESVRLLEVDNDTIHIFIDTNNDISRYSEFECLCATGFQKNREFDKVIIESFIEGNDDIRKESEVVHTESILEAIEDFERRNDIRFDRYNKRLIKNTNN